MDNITTIYSKKIAPINVEFPNRKMILLKPLTKCNLKCKYCYYEVDRSLKTDTILSAAEIRCLLEKIKIDKNDYVFLSGGEFLLHPESIKIAESIKKRAFTILTTNGVEIKNKKYDSLLENVDCVQVSLDSVISSYHNDYRGSQKQTLDSIVYLKEKYINTSLVVVLSKENIQHFNEIMLFAIEHKINSIFIQLLWLPKSHILHNKLVLTENDLESIKTVISFLNNYRDEIIIPEDFYLNILVKYVENIFSESTVKNCFGINNLLTIDPYGNINHCLPKCLIDTSKLYPSTKLLGLPFENNKCAHFSNECMCFWGQVGMTFDMAVT